MIFRVREVARYWVPLARTKSPAHVAQSQMLSPKRANMALAHILVVANQSNGEDHDANAPEG